MKRKILYLATPLAILALALWLWPFGQTGGADQITGEPADRGDIVQIVSSVGSVRALNTVEVGSQLSGQLEELLVDFNSPVAVGDLLARLDPQTFERRAQEAEANLAVARANVTVQAAGIQRAEANLKAAEREYRRQQSLVERGSISQSALDAAEAAWQSALADVAISEAQLLNARATVQQRQAALDAARIDLERTEIRSPIDGVVIQRAVDVGQTVAASLQAPILFTIAQDLTEIQIEASVDEADIGSVREGAEATFGVDAYPEDQFRGRVSQVRLAPNEEGNVVTYTVVISARNPNRRLLPGMTASIDIVTGRRENVLRVANAAVRFRPPDAAEAAAGQPAGPGRGGFGGGRAGAEMTEMLAQLGVSEPVRETIQQELREAFSGMRGMFAGGADRDAIRDRIETMTGEIFRRNLDNAQFAAWQALQRERENTRPATLYVDNRGSLEPRRVRLGISDDRYTEIVGGELAEGETVVTRIQRGAGG